MAKYRVQSEALEYAKKLIRDGKVERDVRDDWSEDAPSSDAGNDFIERHGVDEYAKWFLAVEVGEDKDNKGAYGFPYGDFHKVHRGAVISGKGRAAQYGHESVRDAADELLALIDKG
jgi:hypothetical protein